MAVVHIDPAAWVLVAAGGAGWARGLATLRRRGSAWPAWRSAAWAAGLAAVVVATTSPLALDGATHPTRQAVGWSILLLAAPLLLAWGAPQALAVEVLPPLRARALRRALTGRAARLLTAPPVAWVLLCGSIALVAGPLHAAAGRHEALGEAVQLALLGAGCLFMFPIFSTDPLPRRLRQVSATVYVLSLLPFFTLFGMALESVGAAQVLHTQGAVAAADSVGQGTSSAGGVIWTVGGLGSITLAILVLTRWLRVEERATPGRQAGLDEAAHAQLVAWRARREQAAAEDEERRRAARAGAAGG